VTHLGAGSAGHFVKMVHNGIEYGLMQLIAETYDLLKYGWALTMTPCTRFTPAGTGKSWNRI